MGKRIRFVIEVEIEENDNHAVEVTALVRESTYGLAVGFGRGSSPERLEGYPLEYLARGAIVEAIGMAERRLAVEVRTPEDRERRRHRAFPELFPAASSSSSSSSAPAAVTVCTCKCHVREAWCFECRDRHDKRPDSL